MDHSIYIYGDAIDKYLIEEYHVSKEDLEKDDVRPIYTYHAPNPEYYITTLNGKKVCDPYHPSVTHEGVTYNSVLDYLNEMNKDDFDNLWSDKQSKSKIAHLFRFPGEQHEWFTIANIPHIKAMGVSLSIVKDYRTHIPDCIFYVDGKKCHHGGTNSVVMHNELYRCIESAHTEFASMAIPAAERNKKGIKLLQNALSTRFIPKFYPTPKEVPATLVKFLQLKE